MTKRQTKFGRGDVNGWGSCATLTRRRSAASLLLPWGVQQLSWRCLAVGENFSNRRRKFINARTGHDDAIAAAVSLLGDTQELASVIFPELDVEVLAFNLQFSRLDDVVHFCLTGAILARSPRTMEAKFAVFFTIFGTGTGHSLIEVNSRKLSESITLPRLRRWPLNLQFRAPSYLKASGIETNALFLTSSSARACRIQQIPTLFDHRTLSAQPFRCQSKDSCPRTIRTPRFALAISRCLPPAIYFRSLAA